MSKRRRTDRRREWALWIALAADHAGLTMAEAIALFEDTFLDPPNEDTPETASAYFRIPQMEDHLPQTDAWSSRRADIVTLLETFEAQRESVEAAIAKASPRWRLDRMPAIDRNLLRLGVTEIAHVESIKARSAINGYVELAKRYGEDRSKGFVNGILDQVRRNLGVPFR